MSPPDNSRRTQAQRTARGGAPGVVAEGNPAPRQTADDQRRNRTQRPHGTETETRGCFGTFTEDNASQCTEGTETEAEEEEDEEAEETEEE